MAGELAVLGRLVAVAVLVLVAALAVVGAIAPFSPSGWLALTTVALASSAFVVTARRARRALGCVAGALLLLLLGIRLIGAAGKLGRMVTLPGGTSSRWAGRILDEQDVSLLGARALGLVWRLPRNERERLVPAMHDAYVEMRHDLGLTPSPVLDTLVGVLRDVSRKRPGSSPSPS